MAADRGAYIDQSQSFNVHMSDINYGKLTSMHFYGWKKVRVAQRNNRFDCNTLTLLNEFTYNPVEHFARFLRIIRQIIRIYTDYTSTHSRSDVHLTRLFLSIQICNIGNNITISTSNVL